MSARATRFQPSDDTSKELHDIELDCVQLREVGFHTTVLHHMHMFLVPATHMHVIGSAGESEIILAHEVGT
jgi:hypothetical protein